MKFNEVAMTAAEALRTAYYKHHLMLEENLLKTLADNRKICSSRLAAEIIVGLLSEDESNLLMKS